MRVDEYWRSVPDAPNYLVSDLGRVAHIRPVTGAMRVLKPSRNDRGYLKVCLGRKRQEYVHRLVASAFIGPCPMDDYGSVYQVDHRDFNRSNNIVTNLRYLPFDENRARQRRYGAVAA